MDKIYMLHGFMGTAETHFMNQIERFKDSYEVVAIDLPGHGASTVTAAENYIEETIQFVLNLMKQKGKGYIMGLSLGASLAIHIAMRERDLVKGIILTGYSPFIPEEFQELMEKQYQYFLQIEEHDQEAAEQFKNLHGDKWKTTIKNVLEKMTYHYPSVSGKEIESLHSPALVLNGSEELYEVESALFMKKHNPNISIALIPDAGHTANIDQPEVYNGIVERFLTKTK
ncbi:alpha/beta fold hydrolase [Rossellomorea aquimaris]|uniref:alpha/beta fold hydrolase n=1 Tax=Rossellomorea aquimaris TaxID=189382 RepID=UPI001CD2FAAC|nr:alpha/beta fold hydrolase [Rossellomorea aquimaris]MCA1057201.1 alpha/beta fold hydrolase [Rossellomorea aquimaris]